MNSRALRRLAADHGALHSQPLPPNYLFAPNAADNDDLTQLDILLAGPSHTPFSGGVFKLHLTIPPSYPQQPPTAYFRTPIFHPNVDPQTGGVCVETLKRDWDAKLTLRDILVVISCLLIQPNPDSALNADAGSLIQDEYEAFTKRAEMMTGIHARIPSALKDAVQEAQDRGREEDELQGAEGKRVVRDCEEAHSVPATRSRRTARQRGAVATRRSEASPSGDQAKRRQYPAPTQPFVVQSGDDDVFGGAVAPPRRRQRTKSVSEDSSTMDANQENDEARSPVKVRTPKVLTPRRPPGAPVPLGELSLEDASSDSDSEMAEYPPSPRKSPSKSPQKQRLAEQDLERPESSRDAQRRAPNITPPSNLVTKPLAHDSPFGMSPSPRKKKETRPVTPGKKKPGGVFGTPMPVGDGGIFKPRSPSSSEKKRIEERRKQALGAKLWRLCDGDVERWNRGDFGGEGFGVKAARW
ncbi:Ubiquitin-conjugating enzyme E2 S-C [Teratosphaeria destructans]|uniref:Ubiquitin-conjugating enzyme E2 2 n=1 Tax=Teratosphaeria destructans TaxID=418781 RepID=A0A9W7SXG5_9PEZI|nr:Ubiquitin-conjugating enzyme E2 S-C [Teratosphaeria destructans]